MFQSYNFYPQVIASHTQNYGVDLWTQLCNFREQYKILEEQNIYLRNLIEQMEKKELSEKMTKKKQRRTKEDLNRTFKCPYSGCKKEYASDLAVNLHMKTKHNGGTKTLREALAKDIMLAEEKGDQLPEVSINFPPGYLKEFKKRFFNQK